MTHPIVRTVLGDVEPETLGHTQPHEHLLIDLSRPMPARTPTTTRAADQEPIRLDNYYRVRRHHSSNDSRLQSIEDAVEELEMYAVAGGGCVVDATSMGIGRDAKGLAAIARRSGVHVVMGSGYYCDDYQPNDMSTLTERQLVDEIVGDIRVGVDGTAIRAGVIGEIGLSYPLCEGESKVLRAACIAQRETGAALMIHPGRDRRSPFEALEIVREAGVDPARTIMSHTDRTLFTREDIHELAASGCFVAFDLFGQESSYYPLAPIDMPNDATRVGHIIDLIDDGFGEQVLISQDICHKTNLNRYGGEGFTHILDHVVPLMRRKSISESRIQGITIDNPRRALSFTD